MNKSIEQPTFILSDIDVYEVSLVGKPAIRRKYLLTKSAEDVGTPIILDGDVEDSSNTTKRNKGEVNPMSKLFELLQKVGEENFAELLKDAEISEEEATELLKGAFKVAKELGLELPTEAITEAGFELPKVEVEVVKEVEVIKEVEKEVIVSKEDALLSALTDDQKLEVQALLKVKDDAAKVATEKAEAAEIKAAKEEDLRVTKEFVAVVKDDYPTLPGTPEELGVLLKAIDKKLPEQKEAIFTLLKVAEEALVASKQLEEIGNGGNANDGSSAWSKIELGAKELMEKGDATTMAEAITKFSERNPELYVEYLKEVR